MTPDELKERRANRHATVLRDVEKARRRAELAGDALRGSILAAVNAGATHADVGRAAHLSRARISQIAGKPKDDER